MINNKTRLSICSHEVSKLLKEKGFGVPVPRYYIGENNLATNYEESDREREYRFDCDDFDENWNDGRVVSMDNNSCWGCGNNPKYFQVCSAPTHALAIEWIRDNFNIEVVIIASPINKKPYWRFVISNLEHVEQVYDDLYIFQRHEESEKDERFRTSPQEATDAALLYVLKNLIP